MTRIFREDTVTLDASKISAYVHDVHGPVTVFKDVVIARAIVHEYDDGMAYKPGKELGEAYWTADGMWATSGGHPSTAVISTRDQIHGRTVNPRFTKSLIDPDTKRPMDRGILADLEVFDNKVAPEVLTDMKNGKKTDVSIGFFFDYDDTAGIVDDEEDQSLKGTAYDYVQRNITINHVAFGIDQGRCGMPYCGIGADGVIREIAGDPVGKWKDFKTCVAAIMKENPDYTKEQAEGTCGKIEKQSKEKDFKPTDDYSLGMKKTIDEAKVYLRDVLGKLDAIEFLKDDLVEEEYQGNASNITLSERAKKFHNISDDDWVALTEEEKQDYIDKLPPEKTVEGETNKDEGDAGPRTEAERAKAHFNLSDEDWGALSDEEKQEYVDKLPKKGSGGEDDASDEKEDDCPDCDDDEREVKRIATDLSLEDINKKLTSLKETRDGYREQIRKLDEELYSEPDSEKKRKAALRKQSGELWDKIDDLYDEIHAYTQAKTIKITQAALTDEVTEDEEKETPLNPDEVLEKYRRTVKDKDYPF